MDEDEVKKLIGEHVHEYFLLLRIKVAVRNNIPYPEKYKKVVNVKAFFESQIGQRIVTPDSLVLKIGDGRNDPGGGGWEQFHLYHAISTAGRGS